MGSKGIVVYDYMKEGFQETEYELFIANIDCQKDEDYPYITRQISSLKRKGAFEHCSGFDIHTFCTRDEFTPNGYSLPPIKQGFPKGLLRLYYSAWGNRTIVLGNGFILSSDHTLWQHSRDANLKAALNEYIDAARTLQEMIGHGLIEVNSYDGGFYCTEEEKICRLIDLTNAKHYV